MEELLKSRIIQVLIVSNLLFVFTTVSSCSNAIRSKGARDKEMASRLDLEEKISKLNQNAEEKLKVKNSEIEEEKASHQATKKALVQEQLVNQSLKTELEKVTKLKEALEEDLKESLVSSKSVKSKR